ncbi:PH domain-containing protein [Longispora urticae]
MRFRYSGAIMVAVVFAAFGALPFALSSWWLAPVLLVPAAIGLWAGRAGVDAAPEGLTVRSAVGSRRLDWSEIDGFEAVGKKVTVLLPSGATLPLPAVRPTDVPRLVAAGGRVLGGEADTLGS